MVKRATSLALALMVGTTAFAQGQDSQPYERDLQVIATLIEGGFDNANQSYFDSRGKRDVKHRRLHIDVNKIDALAVGDKVFIASAYWDNDERLDAGDQIWVLSADAETGSVRMRVWPLSQKQSSDDVLSSDALAGTPHCDLYWRREAAQFRAAGASCETPLLPREMVLSDQQLWMILSDEPGDDYRMHRVRDFEC
jgi:hypothetical protein